MKDVPLSELDAEATLTKNIIILETLENKRMSAQGWITELGSQVYHLNKICLAQQKEIEALSRLCRA